MTEKECGHGVLPYVAEEVIKNVNQKNEIKKTIHCSTPAQKSFAITNPCEIARAQLREAFINQCLNQGKKKEENCQGTKQRQITQK